MLFNRLDLLERLLAGLNEADTPYKMQGGQSIQPIHEGDGQIGVRENRLVMYARGLESQVAQGRSEIQSLQAQLSVTLRDLAKLRQTHKNASDTFLATQRDLDRANAKVEAYEKILEAIFRDHLTSPLDCPLSWQNLVQENEQNKRRIQELEYAVLLKRESSTGSSNDMEHHVEHEQGMGIIQCDVSRFY